MSVDVSRRSFGLGVAASLPLLLGARRADAHARTPMGGSLALRVPWSVGSIDPHRLDDAAAALFGGALFDGLYALDETGAAVAALAESEPQPEGGTLRVRVRDGLRTGKNRPFVAADAAASIARARRLGASAWLADIPAPKVDGNTLVFAMRDAGRLARALASPVVAMVPTGFSPEAPDGTGAFVARMRSDGVTLARNPFAACGPSFLDEVVVRAAPDLAASLRAFESGADDLGWLGSGLHEPRPGSKPFDLGAVAYGVLFTGREALSWDAPGVAQRLCDGIPAARFSHLAIGASWPTDTAQGWGGAPANLFVRDDAPWLVELGRAVAATLSRPGHELAVRTVPPNDMAQRRATRAFALAVDVVRPVSFDPLGAIVGLSTADGAGRARDLVTRPPRFSETSPRTMTRTLRAGIIGEIRVQGARIPDVQLAAPAAGPGFDFAASTKVRPR